MRTQFFLVILAIILVGALLLGLSDTVISIPSAGISVKGITSNVNEANNASANAAITITMYAVADE